MTTASEVAKYLIYVSHIVNAEPITNMRLQKLLYFCQATYLKRYNTPMFNDSFERWEYGPVIRTIYKEYDKYANQVIPSETLLESFSLSEPEKDTVIDVLRTLDKYSTAYLVDLTHKKESPWSKGELNTVISKNDIKDTQLKYIPTTDEIVNSLDVEGYTDEYGYVVLGAE